MMTSGHIFQVARQAPFPKRAAVKQVEHHAPFQQGCDRGLMQTSRLEGERMRETEKQLAEANAEKDELQLRNASLSELSQTGCCEPDKEDVCLSIQWRLQI
ncbi:Hypothetical predicted protein [Cloeon dipterum]|uniref:Uncharacterized protein n=1 Tax=Cloeon dipterum TaxID=197152 RepID=A0A8S1DKN9_9INSE|nr:Hypothetical predicted protein [Cloeon dipterum]